MERKMVRQLSALNGLICSCALMLGQESVPATGSLKPFLGLWKGVCADGKDFVIVALTQSDDGALGGTIRLANMRGGEDGQCATVVDPPSEEHALRVSEGKIIGATLLFRGAKRREFEMTVTDAGKAKLIFTGTASEENPWKLERVSR